MLPRFFCCPERSHSSLKGRDRVKRGVRVLGLVWVSSYVPRRDGTPAGSRWSARSREARTYDLDAVGGTARDELAKKLVCSWVRDLGLGIQGQGSSTVGR